MWRLASKQVDGKRKNMDKRFTGRQTKRWSVELINVRTRKIYQPWQRKQPESSPKAATRNEQ